MSSPEAAYLRGLAHVRARGASEKKLQARASLHRGTTGPFAGDVPCAAAAEISSQRMLAADVRLIRTVTIGDCEGVVRCLSLASRLKPLADRLPELLEPFVACRSNVVLVVDT